MDFAFLWQVADIGNNTITLLAQGAPPDSPLASSTSFRVTTVEGEAIEGPLVVGESYGVGNQEGSSLTMLYVGATVNGDPIFQISVGTPWLL
jgi:hypothetical protein